MKTKVIQKTKMILKTCDTNKKWKDKNTMNFYRQQTFDIKDTSQDVKKVKTH